MIKTLFVFLYMRKSCNRKYTSPTNSKVYLFIAISDINKPIRYPLFIKCIVCSAFANEASQ